MASVHPEPVRRTVTVTMAEAAYGAADPLDDGPFVPDETAIVIGSE
jgi:hypothetical protein